MRVLLQRVKHASVRVDGKIVGAVQEGLLAFVGFGAMDGPDLPEKRVWRTMLNKITEMRIFPDAAGKINLSCSEYAASVEPAGEGNCRNGRGGILIVSQFTLYADCRKGRRPSFHPAASPDLAEKLYDRFTAELEKLHGRHVGTGIFGAEMEVDLCNWGPVTILLDSMQFEGGCG